MKVNWNRAEFVRSAAKPADFPRDTLPQVVFAGRSNVGKSSAINRLLGRKNLARVGSAPGKTTHINYFQVDEKLYLVSLQERARWGRLIEAWFADTRLMTLGLLIVDARHKPTADDRTMSDFFLDTGKPYMVVANKLDKLKNSQIEENLSLIRQTLELPGWVELIPFSAEKGDGKERLLELILEHTGWTG